MSSRFYSSGRKRSSGKTAPDCLTQTFKEGERTIPTRAFLSVHHFSSSLSRSHSLISLWCPIHFHLYLLSLSRSFFSFFFSASLTFSLAHAFSVSRFYIWPIIRLKNTQLNLFWYNEYSPSLVNPSLKRQFALSLSSGLSLVTEARWPSVLLGVYKWWFCLALFY